MMLTTTNSLHVADRGRADFFKCTTAYNCCQCDLKFPTCTATRSRLSIRLQRRAFRLVQHYRILAAIGAIESSLQSTD